MPGARRTLSEQFANARATRRPSSSTLFISAVCGSVPALYLTLKRHSPSSRTVAAIFPATVSGLPTHSAPEPASRSNCSRVTGGQPRSAPTRAIVAR
jgi:hypothetical protein